MTTDDRISSPVPTGIVKVSVASTSELFRHQARVSVHDSRMMPVQLDSQQREFELPAGLYQVSAVLQDGFEHRQLFRVVPDSKLVVALGDLGSPVKVERDSPETRVSVRAHQDVRKSTIGPWETARPARRTELRDPKPPAFEELELAMAAPPISGSEPHQAPAPGEITLVATEGAEAEAMAPGQWRLQALENTLAVPTATVESGGCRYTISLPIFRSSYSRDSAACHLMVNAKVCGGRPDAWVAPERTVARALQNMLASGHLSSAIRTADDATEALRDKYTDPAGAALGALILHRFGRLDGRRLDWLENLARDFPWLPDGRILLATHLVKQRGDTRRAHELALSAAAQRILYAESFSLLLDLLRRWRGPEVDQAGHGEALTLLAGQSSFVDWSSICLSISARENEDA